MDKFGVKYRASGRNLKFFGKGAVYMYDTSLVLEGEMPKFWIPVIAWFYHRLLNVRSMRTIPYSVILAYKPPSASPNPSRAFHRIIYQLPDGTTKNVRFKMLNNRRENNESFRTQLEEYLTAAKTLAVG